MPETTRNRILKPYAQHLRKNMTLAEQRLWYFLRNKQLNGIKFRRQQTIGHYIVDFVSMEHKLIIELDGGQHVEQVIYDNQRTEFLNEQGYRVIRFWNNDVLQNIEIVLDEILKACGGFPPP